MKPSPSLGSILICLAFLAVARGWAASPQLRESIFTAQEIAQGFRHGAVIAKPKAGLAAAELAAEENRQGIVVAHRFNRLGGLRVIQTPADEDPTVTAQRLTASGLYEYVEPDYLRTARTTPNDPRFAEQWYLHNTGQSNGKIGADISAPTGWSTRTSTGTVIVGLMDTGVLATHEDLAPNLWTNAREVAGNGVDDDGDGFVDDVHGINALVAGTDSKAGDIDDQEGHGTSVAGVLCASGNNATGITGVAWQSQLMVLKFADSTGHGSVSAFATCIDYAIAKGVSVINYSYGSHVFSQAEYDAIKRARDAGIILVVAAGNDGASTEIQAEYPAQDALENIVTVANTDRNDQLSADSSYGSGVVDLAAPGTDILTCDRGSTSGYASVSGTSLAAPSVTGALALIKAQFPGENYRSTINRLLNSVDPLTSLNGKVQTSGRLNLAKALTSTSTRPFNDDFANRAILGGDNLTVRGCSIGATAEANEPKHANVTGGASVWYSWTPTQSGTTVIDTSGSSFDTVVAVYTGTSVGSLTAIASNDDNGGQTTSRLTFNATAGTTYAVAIDGKNAATGLIAFQIGILPPNDNFSAAIAVPTSTLSIDGTTHFATKESGEPTLTSTYSTGAGSTVWYKWTATKASTYTASVFTDAFSPIVGVFTGGSVSSLVKLDVYDDDATFDTTPGTTYYIVVDSANKTVGSFNLTVKEALAAIHMTAPVTSSMAVGSDGSYYMLDSSGFFYYFFSSSNYWFKNLDSGVDVSTPAIGPDGSAYVATFSSLYRIAPSGTINWQKNLASSGIESSPTLGGDGSVYVHTDDGYLQAFLPDGTFKWKTSVPGTSYSSASVGNDGTLYIGSTDGNLYAIGPTDGAVKWRFSTGGDIYTSPAIDTDGTIYVGNLNGNFYAVKTDGTQKWTFTAGDSITSSPAIGSDGSIYFGCYDGKVYSLTSSGAKRWTYSTNADIRATSPLVASNGLLYIGSNDKYIYAINTSNGTLNQNYATGANIRSSAVIDRGAAAIGSSDERYYALDVGNGTASGPWPMHRHNAARTGRRAPSTPPVIYTQPIARIVGVGQPLTLSVGAEGADTLTFQWYFNGIAISGATMSTYTVASAANANAGSYTVTVSNGRGSVTSTPVSVQVATASDLGHLINISARAFAGTGAQTLTVGFVVDGSGTKPLLIRGVGPKLTTYGVTGVMTDPTIALKLGTQTLQENDDWGSDPQVPAITAQVNAFALDAGSKDAAMVANIAPNGYTVQLTGNSGSGVALAEFYDASPVFTAGTPKMINISARGYIGSGDANNLIVGFVIGGKTPLKVLIRGVGPGLIQYGVTGTIDDPQIVLNDANSHTLATNNDWASSANLSQINSATSQANAFTLAAKDSAIVITLDPGAYTVQASGVNGGTGVGLVEVYALP